MRLLLVLILAGSLVVILILNLTPISAVEIALAGGNSFIPATFGTACAATVAAFAVGTAIWVAPRIVAKNRIARDIAPGGTAFMIQSTAQLKKAFADARLPTLTTLSVAQGAVTIQGSRGAVASVVAADILEVEVNPRGYQGRLPTIEMTVRRGGSIHVADFVLAKDGHELFPERRLPKLRELRDRIAELDLNSAAG